MEGWVNVSSKGDLNLLHHHSECTWSGVYYVESGRGDVEGFIGGQLLLRMTRGMGGVEDRGVGNTEPDEATAGQFPARTLTRTLMGGPTCSTYVHG